MNAKEYLEQARFLDMRITAKLAQLEELEKLMLKAEGSVGKIAGMREEINRDIDELVDRKREITDLIRRVSKPEYQTLLELRYLCFWNWEKISMNMHYSRSQLFNLLPCALEEIKRILTESEKSEEDH